MPVEVVTGVAGGCLIPPAADLIIETASDAA
jgi:hypothetical protein